MSTSASNRQRIRIKAYRSERLGCVRKASARERIGSNIAGILACHRSQIEENVSKYRFTSSRQRCAATAKRASLAALKGTCSAATSPGRPTDSFTNKSAHNQRSRWSLAGHESRPCAICRLLNSTCTCPAGSCMQEGTSSSVPRPTKAASRCRYDY